MCLRTLFFVGALVLLQRQAAAQSSFAELPRYTITVALKPTAPRLSVEATLTMPAPDSGPPSFVLAEMFTMESVELHDGRSFRKARADSAFVPSMRPGWGYVRWRLHEDVPRPAGAEVLARVRYRLDTAAAAFVFGVNDAVTFASGINTSWYPQVEDGKPANRGPLRTRRGTGTMRFEVPEGVIVHAIGTPSSASGDRPTHFAFDVSVPGHLNFAAGRFHVRTSVSSERGLPSTATYYLAPRDSAGTYARLSLAVLKALVAEFGPYPFSHFAIVELPDELADRAGFAGASTDGAIFTTSTYLDGPFNSAFYGHEIGHQWWGVTIRPDGPRGAMMLQEGLAQYGALRAIEAIEGTRSARVFREREYPNYFGYGGERYFRVAAGGRDAPLAELPVNEGWARDIADTKGFMVMNVLAHEIGRDRLRTAFHEMVREFAARRLSWDDFLRVVSRAAARDMSLFFNQWFDRTGAPELVTELVPSAREVRVRQIGEGSPFHFSTDLAWFGGGCGQRTPITVRTSDERVAFPAGCRPDSAVVDPEYQVLRWTPALRDRYGKRK